MENTYTKDQLRTYQALPLDVKVGMTMNRIREWHRHFGGAVCVSFSGGKDSTVLLHLVRQYDPSVKALFVNTGLEYPEIQSFVRSKDNVEVVRPEMRFDEVISTYGYPLISKEVAEAIYYARRIRSQTVQVERERESGREETERIARNPNLIETSAHKNRRTILQGVWGHPEANRQTDRQTDRQRTNVQKRAELTNDRKTDRICGGVRRPWLGGTTTNRERGIGTYSTDSKPG